MQIKEEWSRTARIYGDRAVERLSLARVAVFGVGGVGGFACEALARAGVGAIDIFDKDTSHLTKTFERTYGISPISYRNRKGV